MAKIEWLKSDPYLDPEPADMEFRLTYEGVLYGDKTNRPWHKHNIRKEFHKQLARIWQINPALNKTKFFNMKGSEAELRRAFTAEELASGQFGFMQVGVGDWTQVTGLSMAEFLARKHRRGVFRFVPLVREELSLITSIHILFLRPDLPGSILSSSGDIDGRIKTLFDAFQIPKDGQLAADDKPEEGEDPFFVLVEDDELISNFSVETDLLLQPIKDVPSRNDAKLVISVKLRPYHSNRGNEGWA